MSKSYYSLGLMSGTSMDGVDASIIQSDGETKYKVIIDKYFEYPQGIYKDLTKLRDKIKSSKDLKEFSRDVKNIEKEITLFHGKAVNQILKKTKAKVDFIGFHGQTIYHNAREKISRQLGDGKLLSKITKKTVVYDFRQNDLQNGGEGAPLTPIFNKLMCKNFYPEIFLNIGGISNQATIGLNGDLSASDIGPGMCLIDKWIRLNTKKQYDKKGAIAKSGKINKKILEKELEKFLSQSTNIKSFDVNDFDISFVESLSLKDGAATLTEYTARVIVNYFINHNHLLNDLFRPIYVAGGGRKNEFLLNRLNDLGTSLDSKGLFQTPLMFHTIDNSFDGDFVESQAFAYLAIRSHLKLPISFSETTGVKKPCTAGVIIKY